MFHNLILKSNGSVLAQPGQWESDNIPIFGDKIIWDWKHILDPFFSLSKR